MRNKRKSALAILLILAGLLSGVTGCGDNGKQPENTSGDADTSTEESTADPNYVPDDLPECDFEGRTFKTVTYSDMLSNYFIESEDGDVIHDAIYDRNRTVEERFNVKLEAFTPGNHEETATYIMQTVLAQDEEFQLAEEHVVKMGTLVTSDLFMNWYDIPYVDFSKPWWSKSTTEDLTYGKDVAFLAIGDYTLSALSGTYCYFFDKKEAADYQIEDLYKVVNDGKWTIDYIANLAKGIYTDINGNSERDDEDYYGLTESLFSPLNAYLWSFGGKIYETDNDGIPQLVYGGEKMNDIFTKLYDLCWNNEGVCTSRSQYTGEWDKLIINSLSFRDDLSLLVPGTIGNAVGSFRTRTHEYGILPYPKFDEEQKEYKTMVDGSHNISAVPKTISDPEFVGTIIEALNAESHRQVFPVYYETALKVKYSYDDESVQMLDMIVANRVFDFGYVYDGWKGFSFYPQDIIGLGKSSNFESNYAKKSSASIKYYEDILNFFADKKAERDG